MSQWKATATATSKGKILFTHECKSHFIRLAFEEVRDLIVNDIETMSVSERPVVLIIVELVEE